METGANVQAMASMPCGPTGHGSSIGTDPTSASANCAKTLGIRRSSRAADFGSSGGPLPKFAELVGARDIRVNHEARTVDRLLAWLRGHFERGVHDIPAPDTGLSQPTQPEAHAGQHCGDRRTRSVGTGC